MAAIVFGLTLGTMSVVFTLVWRHAVAARLVRADADRDGMRALTARLATGLGIYVVAIGPFFAVAALILYLVIAPYLLVPSGWFRRQRKPARPA